MSEFLIYLLPHRPALLKGDLTPEEQTCIDAHFAYLSHLSDLGVVKFAGRTTRTDEGFGLVLLQAESEQAAQDIMSADPAVRSGLMRASLWPFRTAIRR